MAAETNTLKKDWRRLIWITAGLLTVLVAWNIYHGRKSYRAYAVLNQQDVSQGSLVGYEPFKRGFLEGRCQLYRRKERDLLVLEF